MLRCFFWNQYRNDLTDVVQQAATQFRPDIFAFCETGSSPKRTLQALNKSEDYYFTTGRIEKRFHIFTRFPQVFAEVRAETERWLILDICLPARDRFLLMVLHGPSKSAGWTPSGHALEMSHYVSALRRAQEEYEISHTVIVGDFNMNPFDPGMVGAAGFNAVMDARQARKKKRTVQKRQYEYFYNPMWNLLGDVSPGPPASFFYDSYTQEELQWHMLDQVIVSPEMIEYLDVESVRIVDKIGDVSLVTRNGRPRKLRFSDHLPIYFELRI